MIHSNICSIGYPLHPFIFPSVYLSPPLPQFNIRLHSICVSTLLISQWHNTMKVQLRLILCFSNKHWICSQSSHILKQFDAFHILIFYFSLNIIVALEWNWDCARKMSNIFTFISIKMLKVKWNQRTYARTKFYKEQYAR